jgi:hypothetical protein
MFEDAQGLIAAPFTQNAVHPHAGRFKTFESKQGLRDHLRALPE